MTLWYMWRLPPAQASLQSMAEKEGLLDEQGRVDVHFPFFLLVLQAAA